MRGMCQGVDWPIWSHLEQAFIAINMTRQSHILNSLAQACAMKPCSKASKWGPVLLCSPYYLNTSTISIRNEQTLCINVY